VLCSVQQHPARIDIIGTQLSEQLVRPLAQVQPVARHISLRHENTIGHLLACDRPPCEAVRPQFVEKSLVVGMSRGCADETNGERYRGKSCDPKLSFHHVTFGSAARAAGAIFSTVAAAVPESRVFAKFWHGLHRPPPRPSLPTRLLRRPTATATMIVTIAFTLARSAVKSSSGVCSTFHSGGFDAIDRNPGLPRPRCPEPARTDLRAACRRFGLVAE